MAVNAKMRQRIDGLVRIYLNALEAHQSGWNEHNIVASFEEYQGDLPSANTPWKASDFVLNQAERLRGKHARLPLAVFLLGRVKPCACNGTADACDTCSGFGFLFTGGILKPQYSIALLARIFYPNETAQMVADKIGLSDKAFTGRLTKAREAAAAELEKVDLLSMLLEADRQSGLVMA